MRKANSDIKIMKPNCKVLQFKKLVFFYQIEKTDNQNSFMSSQNKISFEIQMQSKCIIANS